MLGQEAQLQFRLMFQALSLHAKRASAHYSPGCLPAGFHLYCPVDRSLCMVYERKPEKLQFVIFVPRVQRLLYSKMLVENTVKKIIQNLEIRQGMTVCFFSVLLEHGLTGPCKEYLLLLTDRLLSNLHLPWMRTQTALSYMLTWGFLFGRNTNNFCLVERLRS